MKFGIIGCGKMGSAVLNGVIESKVFKKEDIIIYDAFDQTREKLSSLGFNTAKNAQELIDYSDVVLFSVKPQELHNVFDSFSTQKKLLVVSIMAGVSIGTLAQKLTDCMIARVMPNTCAMIGKSASSICFSDNCTEQAKQSFIDIVGSFGSVTVIDESLMDDVIPLAGSFTAYAYYYAKCFVDSAVKRGVDEKVAISLVTESMIGSAMMIQTSGKDLNTLISDVCSKGGTTLAGLSVLEENGLDKIVDECSIKCADRSRELGKNK